MTRLRCHDTSEVSFESHAYHATDIPLLLATTATDKPLLLATTATDKPLLLATTATDKPLPLLQLHCVAYALKSF